MTADEYLYSTEETNRRRELAAGVLREPPAPFYSHQHILLRVARVLCDHVEARALGQVGVAPIDVVLDHARDVIVQPDVLFIAADRLSIIDKQVWGAPDLVVEIVSRGTAAHDRGQKVGWYQQYGVREYWMVDLSSESVVVVQFHSGQAERHVARGTSTIDSRVLPDLKVAAVSLFL